MLVCTITRAATGSRAGSNPISCREWIAKHIMRIIRRCQFYNSWKCLTANDSVVLKPENFNTDELYLKRKTRFKCFVLSCMAINECGINDSMFTAFSRISKRLCWSPLWPSFLTICNRPPSSQTFAEHDLPHPRAHVLASIFTEFSGLHTQFFFFLRSFPRLVLLPAIRFPQNTAINHLGSIPSHI